MSSLVAASNFISSALQAAGITVHQSKVKWGYVRVYCDVDGSTEAHKEAYSRAYLEAVRKWPDARDGIIIGADYPELLKGWT